MADVVPFPRKRRTRGHVIADLAINHVERIILESGFTAERTAFDYGHDLKMTTFDRSGYVEAGCLPIQVKGSERLKRSADGRYFLISIERRDIESWLGETLPVLFILYEAATRRAFWLNVQHYFSAVAPEKARLTTATVRVRIPILNRLTPKALESMRRLKNNAVISTNRWRGSRE